MLATMHAPVLLFIVKHMSPMLIATNKTEMQINMRRLCCVDRRWARRTLHRRQLRAADSEPLRSDRARWPECDRSLANRFAYI